MRNFVELYQERCLKTEKPWLILGKGPSFSKRCQFDLTGFHLLGLNHVVRELSVTISHAIDMEVVEICGEAIERNCEYFVMPWIPSVGMQPGELDLSAWLAFSPTLHRLDQENRLLWYNLNTASRMNGSSPLVTACYFSAEAALSLLAISGAKTVRTLGIDGGTNYSSEFDDLSQTTKLRNGHPSYDLQFKGLDSIVTRFELDYGALDVKGSCRSKAD